MNTCKKCTHPYQHGAENLCAECWIQEYQVEVEPAAAIRAGAYIHTVNCNACRRINQAYCPKCVD